MLTLILLALPMLLVLGVGVAIYTFNLVRGSRRYL
jgi:hypothetical protein